MLGFIVSVMIFCSIVAVISFVAAATNKVSNEAIGKFVNSSELCSMKPSVTVETATSAHVETTLDATAPLVLQASEIADDVLESVFSEIEQSEMVVSNTVSQIPVESEQLLNELVIQLQSSSSLQADNLEEQNSTDLPVEIEAEKTMETEEIVLSSEHQDITDSEVVKCLIPQEEMEHLVSLYGIETMKDVTSTPAFGRTGEKEIMIGRVKKEGTQLFLTYNESNIEVSKAASLFVGEMVIISATYVNEKFLKIDQIQLVNQTDVEEEYSESFYSVI